MLTDIDLTAPEWGNQISNAGFSRVSARRYLRVTDGDVAQRIELRPNRHGGELTCDLTIHPLWAREYVSLSVLEPGVWINHLCDRCSLQAPIWYDRSESGIQQMVDAIINAGMPWFEETSTAEGIVESATLFPEPWRNTQHVHVELGHSYLRAGHLEQAQEVFDRKPNRVPRYKTLSGWISVRDISRINELHAQWVASSRSGLEQMGA